MDMSVGSAEQPTTRAQDVATTDMRQRVRQILSEHGRLTGAIDQLSDSSDLYAAGLTSLATVSLMLALEEGFEIEFPDAMLSRKTFTSIDSLVAAVQTLRAS